MLAGLAGAAVFGLSRAHFVGAQGNGHVAVYQGVPWNLPFGVHLYRDVYESPLLAVQLSQAERKACSTTTFCGAAASTPSRPTSSRSSNEPRGQRPQERAVSYRNRELTSLIAVAVITGLGFASVYIARQEVVSTVVALVRASSSSASTSPRMW